MSAYVWGSSSSSPSPIGGFQATQDEKGGWVYKQQFRALRTSLSSSTFRNTFTAGTPPTTIDTNAPSYFSTLGLVKTDVRDNADGTLTVAAEFTGYSADFSGSGQPSTETIPKYELSGSLTQKSILEHPTVRGFGQTDREIMKRVVEGSREYGWDSTDGLVVYVIPDDTSTTVKCKEQPSSGDPEAWVKKALAGVSSYFSPTYKWTKRWQGGTGLSSTDLNDMGKIDAPGGSPPEAGSGRDWMMTSCHQTQSGELYDKSVWTLSDDDGWDSDLYS